MPTEHSLIYALFALLNHAHSSVDEVLFFIWNIIIIMMMISFICFTLVFFLSKCLISCFDVLKAVQGSKVQETRNAVLNTLHPSF